jgi:hypothetical protein
VLSSVFGFLDSDAATVLVEEVGAVVGLDQGLDRVSSASLIPAVAIDPLPVVNIRGGSPQYENGNML